MITTKSGEKITWKEFFQRWKKGIEGITPLQQTKSLFTSNVIMFIGIFCGLIISLFHFKSLWWLTIVLLGGVINILINMLATWQKLILLKMIEDSLKLNEEPEEKNVIGDKTQQLKQDVIDEANKIIKVIDDTKKDLKEEIIEETNKKIDKEFEDVARKVLYLPKQDEVKDVGNN